MKFSKLVPIAGFCISLSSVGNAQFSVSGGGSLIPASGSGGDAAVIGDGGALYDTVQPGLEGMSAATVGVAVTSIESIQIDGLNHSWIGDTQGTLSDPNGVEHLIWLRPGYLNTSAFGSSGDFDGGSYTFVGDGSGMSLPTSSANTNIPAGTYNQSFTSGGTTWISGTNGINNTPMNSITGPAGDWTLHIYDWAGGDSGGFAGWTLNGNGGGGGGPNTGAAYCFGDGTGATCPFGNFGAAGEGCLNSSGTGAVATATGSAEISNDSWVITVTGAAFNKPGLFFQGPTTLALPAGAGILCSNSTLRYSVNPTDATGSTSQAGFGVNASIGQTLNYQYWFRDPGFPGAGSPQFNFTNAWRVTWI